MSAGIKYRLEAFSNKYADVYRIDILEEDYNGAIQYKNIGANKIQFEKKEGIIQLTSLVISIQADLNFEYLGFFQYNNRKYPVQFYKNNTQIWSGFVVSESYQEPYINPPYDVEIVATDGLGFLSNYKFNNNGIQTRLQALIHCLNNLGLNLSYSFAIDLFEENMNTSLAMFDQSYFYGEIFYDEDCETVVKYLLPVGVKLTQHNNQWLIRRVYDDAEKTHLVYDYQGNYSGTQNGETLLSLGSVSEGGVWPHGSPLLTMNHAWRNAQIIKNYGKSESFLLNYDFSLQTTENWTNATNGDVTVKLIDDTYFAQIEGYVSPGSDLYLEQGGVDVVNTKNSSGGFFFELKYDALAANSATTLAPSTGINLTVKVMVMIVGATQTYYLTANGWQTTAEKIELDIVSSVGKPNWNDLKIITNSIPIDGNLIVRLYRLEYTSGGSPRNRTSIGGVLFTDVKVYTQELIEYIDPEKIDVDIRENAADADNKIELKPVDLPDIKNANLLFKNGNYIKNGSDYELSRLWVNNSENAVLFHNIIINQLIGYYGQPTQKLSGCNWRGAGLNLNSIAQHILNRNRKFIADYGTWDILNDTFNITWVEKPNSASGTDEPWILENGIWDNDAIWKNEENWKTAISFEFTGAGDHDITSAFTTGDTIDSLPDAGPGLADEIKEDSTIITSIPHTFAGTNLYYKTAPLAVSSYQVLFDATISGEQTKIQIKINL